MMRWHSYFSVQCVCMCVSARVCVSSSVQAWALSDVQVNLLVGLQLLRECDALYVSLVCLMYPRAACVRVADEYRYRCFHVDVVGGPTLTTCSGISSEGLVGGRVGVLNMICSLGGCVVRMRRI